MFKNIVQWAVLVALAVLVFAACNDSESGSTAGETTASNPPAATPADIPAAPEEEAMEVPAKSMAEPGGEDPGTEVASADAIYAKSNCAMCHGHNLEGGKLGPALSSLTEHGWDSELLSAYLENPADHSVNGERLAELNEQYSMSMPPFTGTEEERRQLAEWLLTK